MFINRCRLLTEPDSPHHQEDMSDAISPLLTTSAARNGFAETYSARYILTYMVGVKGLEPSASCSQNKHSAN